VSGWHLASRRPGPRPAPGLVPGPVPAPVVKGQTIGQLKVWRGDDLALVAPLTAADDVGTGTMSQRAMDGATELMIGLLRAGVDKL